MFPLDQDYIFIADESGISNDRFTVVGGLCMHKSTVIPCIDAIKEYRNKTGMHAELKWTRVSNQKETEYKELIEYFFALNNSNLVHFHSIVFDSHKWQHRKYNDGDADVGISKLYYLLLVHKFAKLCGREGTLYIRLDHRNSSTPLEDLRRMINATVARDHGIATNPVKHIASVDSHQCDLLQLNDVVLGAVSAARNGKHLLPSTREAKRTLAKTVLEKSGLTTFEQDSPRDVNRFTLWNMVPRT